MNKFDELYEGIINEKERGASYHLSDSDMYDILIKLVKKTDKRQNKKLNLSDRGEWYILEDGYESIDEVSDFSNWPTIDDILDINNRGERWTNITRDFDDAVERKVQDVKDSLEELIDEVGSTDIKKLLKEL